MIYLDNAATTKVLDGIDELYKTYEHERYYNPSALYADAIAVNRDVTAARRRLCRLLGAEDNTLLFTSCGSESDNQALFCTSKKRGARIIISAAEHAAVYQSAMALKQQGYDVVLCPVDCHGQVHSDALAALLTHDTALVSVMHVNNETGAVNDIARLVKTVKQFDSHILFHSDGVQAFGKIPVNVRALGVDLYSLSAHKLGAPKGLGALYVRKGVHVAPLIYGGGQEQGLRSGTENVLGILSFAQCAESAVQRLSRLQEEGDRLHRRLHDYCEANTDCMLLSPMNGAPHIGTIAFRTVRGEVMMHTLESSGIIVGIGSACSSKKATGRIAQALGLTDGYQTGMVRMSINAYDDYDWDYVFDCMQSAYLELRKYLRG